MSCSWENLRYASWTRSEFEQDTLAKKVSKQGSTLEASTHRQVHKTKVRKWRVVAVEGRSKSERTLHKGIQSGKATINSNLGSSLS